MLPVLGATGGADTAAELYRDERERRHAAAAGGAAADREQEAAGSGCHASAGSRNAYYVRRHDELGDVCMTAVCLGTCS